MGRVHAGVGHEQPAPLYNFAKIPVVHSRMPLWEGDAGREGGIPHGRVRRRRSIDAAGTKVGEVRDPESDVKRMSAHDLGIACRRRRNCLSTAAAISAIFIGRCPQRGGRAAQPVVDDRGGRGGAGVSVYPGRSSGAQSLTEKCQVPSTKCQANGTRYLAPGTRH